MFNNANYIYTCLVAELIPVATETVFSRMETGRWISVFFSAFVY